MQNFIRINSYVLNIFCRTNSKKDIWRNLFFSTLFSKFRHIPPRFLSAQKLTNNKDHLKKRIKLFPVCNDFFLISNPILTELRNKCVWKKWEKTGNSFILFFKWYLITLKFWELKNLTGFGRNFEKMVDKIRFLQIFSSEKNLQKILNT